MASYILQIFTESCKYSSKLQGCLVLLLSYYSYSTNCHHQTFVTGPAKIDHMSTNYIKLYFC